MSFFLPVFRTEVDVGSCPPFCLLPLQPLQLLHRLSGSLSHEHSESSSNRSLSSKENRSPSASQSNIKSIVGGHNSHKENTGDCQGSFWNFRIHQSPFDPSPVWAYFLPKIRLFGKLIPGKPVPCNLLYLSTWPLLIICWNNAIFSGKFGLNMLYSCSPHNNNKCARKSSSDSAKLRSLAGARRERDSSLSGLPFWKQVFWHFISSNLKPSEAF